jgi:hypothetical protein
VSAAENNKALVRRFYAEIDKGNIGIVDELVADYIDHNRAFIRSKIRSRKATRSSRA